MSKNFLPPVPPFFFLSLLLVSLSLFNLSSLSDSLSLPLSLPPFGTKLVKHSHYYTPITRTHTNALFVPRCSSLVQPFPDLWNPGMCARRSILNTELTAGRVARSGCLNAATWSITEGAQRSSCTGHFIPELNYCARGSLDCKEQKCVHIINLLAIYHVIQSVTFLPCQTEDNDCWIVNSVARIINCRRTQTLLLSSKGPLARLSPMAAWSQRERWDNNVLLYGTLSSFFNFHICFINCLSCKWTPFRHKSMMWLQGCPVSLAVFCFLSLLRLDRSREPLQTLRLCFHLLNLLSSCIIQRS